MSVSRSAQRLTGASVTVVVSDDQSEPRLSRAYARLACLHHAEYVRGAEWQGIGGARNHGVAQLGTMTQLLFIDADDEIHQDCLASLARLATECSIVTALCRVTRRGHSCTPAKAQLFHLLEAHAACRITPLLYMNIIGQPSLLPAGAFDAVGGYLERRYSGEHVDLWGRMILGGHITSISLIQNALYHYLSTAQGNYRRDLRRHRLGVATALTQLTNLYFHKHTEYRWVARGPELPSLYAPIGRGGRQFIPPWATVGGAHWSLRELRRDLPIERAQPELRFLLKAGEAACREHQ